VTLPDDGVSLVTQAMPPGVDTRRGIVRISADAFAALGGPAWSVVQLTGRRRTAALAAPAGPELPAGHIWVDDLVLTNAGAAPGDSLHVRIAPSVAADRLALAGSPQVMSTLPPQTLRLALLGKVVSAGDVVSLLQQDYALPTDVTEGLLTEARRQLQTLFGPGWPAILLSVTEAPTVPAVVTMSTEVIWAAVPATPASTVGTPAATRTAADASAVPDGAEAQAAELRDMLDVALNSPELLGKLGATASLGVLLSGPVGCGKASLVHAVAGALGLEVVAVSGPDLVAMPTDQAQQRIAALRPAQIPARSVVLVEDVEVVAPRAEDVPVEAAFTEVVRELVTAGRAVVCTTSAAHDVSRRLVAPDVLSRELVVPLPDQAARQRMLTRLTGRLQLAPDVALDAVAARTPGFVAADLTALVRAAGLEAAERERHAATPSPSPQVAAADFDAALRTVHASAMDGQLLDTGDVTLDDVGGLGDVKQTLTEAVIWPVAHPETFTRMGIDPPRGVLLYGPPGCGKTFLVKALAHDGRANLLSVKGAELLSKWVGESEAGVRELFQRARGAAPSIVFLDEVDALAPVRGADDNDVGDRVVAALLTELDGIDELHGVVVVAATNRPDMVDPAMLRPGRLEQLVFVAPPDADARAAIMLNAAKKTPLTEDVDLRAVANRCEGFSGADCVALVRQSALSAMRRSLSDPQVTAVDVETALRGLPPSLDPAQVEALRA